MKRREFINSVSCGCAASGLAGCFSTNLATGDSNYFGSSDTSTDIALGRKEHTNIVKQFGGVYDDPKLQSYVDEIGLKLASHAEYQEFDYRFVILDSPIVNALALPGGLVYLSRGLLALASSEAEMAAVIGHELGHVTGRHSVERLNQGNVLNLGATVLSVLTGVRAVGDIAAQGANIYLRGFSRSQELEADQLGIRYLSKAGYNPFAAVDFLDSLRDYSILQARVNNVDEATVDQSSILATHPRTQERVEKAYQLAKEKAGEGPNRLGRKSYLTQIEGLVFGQGIKDGLVKDNRFYHRDLRCTFDIPADYQRLQSEQIAFRHADGATNSLGSFVFSTTDVPLGVSMVDYLQYDWLHDQRANQLTAFKINKLPAAQSDFPGKVNGQNVYIRAVALRFDNQKIYRFIFYSKPNDFSSAVIGFDHMIDSFTKLSTIEAEKIKPPQIKIVTITDQNNLSEYIKEYPFGENNDFAFKVYNDLKESSELPQKGRFKIISDGF